MAPFPIAIKTPDGATIHLQVRFLRTILVTAGSLIFNNQVQKLDSMQDIKQYLADAAETCRIY